MFTYLGHVHGDSPAECISFFACAQCGGPVAENAPRPGALRADDTNRGIHKKWHLGQDKISAKLVRVTSMFGPIA